MRKEEEAGGDRRTRNGGRGSRQLRTRGQTELPPRPKLEKERKKERNGGGGRSSRGGKRPNRIRSRQKRKEGKKERGGSLPSSFSRPRPRPPPGFMNDECAGHMFKLSTPVARKAVRRAEQRSPQTIAQEIESEQNGGARAPLQVCVIK